MKSQTTHAGRKAQASLRDTFHGAALIDANGREVPITESMVQKACQSLEAQWRYPLTLHSAN
jgi:hypothetical protein